MARLAVAVAKGVGGDNEANFGSARDSDVLHAGSASGNSSGEL